MTAFRALEPAQLQRLAFGCAKAPGGTKRRPAAGGTITPHTRGGFEHFTTGVVWLPHNGKPAYHGPRDWERRFGNVIMGERHLELGKDVCTACGAESFTKGRIAASLNCHCGNNRWRNTASGLEIYWDEPLRPSLWYRLKRWWGMT